MSILSTNQLRKKYGRLVALDALDVSIEPGMVFGLLGPNGSGKTTTLGILLGVLKASSGDFTWFNEKPSAENRKKIGAILEHPCFYPYMTGEQNLRVAAKIKEVESARIDEVLDQVGLLDRKTDKFKTYSLGMKQRLAIGSALLSDPRVLVLDEPTNGLDPQGIAEIRELIRQIASSGKTIILASHLLDEVQKVCTDFMVLRKGKKLFQGSVKDALRTQASIEVGAEDMGGLLTILNDYSLIQSIEREDEFFRVEVPENVTTANLNAHLVSKKIVATHLVQKSGSLEEEFLRILQEND